MKDKHREHHTMREELRYTSKYKEAKLAAAKRDIPLWKWLEEAVSEFEGKEEQKMANLTVKEVIEAGGKVPGLGRKDQFLVDQLACKLCGVLAEAPTQETRRKALEKARRMLGVR